MRPFSFCLHAILFCYYQILYCIIGRRGRFTNLSTPFFHVYLSGTYPRCVRQLVEHRGHRPRTLPLPLRLLGGVPRILQLPCLVDRTARPVSRLVDVPRRARRSRTAQPRTRAPLRRGVAAPYPVGNLHDGLLRALRARQRDGVVSLRRLCGRAGRCCGRGGGAVGRRCRLPCAGVRLHRRIRLFSTVVFSKPDSGRPRSVDDASATDAASGSQKRRSWDSTR